MIQLVNMPFGSMMRAPLALGLIKAQLADAGLKSQVRNLNFAFASAIGFGQYEMIARFKGVETQVSEWLFAEAAWRRSFGPSEDQFLLSAGEELDTIPNVAEPAQWLKRVRHEVVPAYLEHCVQTLVASEQERPTVIAFSCMFFQTVAALALGRLIKERYPDITLAYGGVCFHGEAGAELFEKVPWMDVVSVGEADEVIVPLFRALAQGEPAPALPGVMARSHKGQAAIKGPPPTLTPAHVLNALPDPSYDDFLVDAAEVGLADNLVWLDRASMPFESSRGCWWGQKKHCTFCGLNGEGMAFRQKEPKQVVASLRRLSSRYPIRNLQATDNIMAMPYFKSMLPLLAEEPLTNSLGQRVDLFYEVKANLKRAQIKALADAGVRYIQPGIENLSSHILDVIDKGVRAIQNVAFIKYATEYALLPIWSILIRIPGERTEDYAAMEALIPRLAHLRPPTGGTPRVECHRYSPYFFRHEQYLSSREPARWYRGIFPEEVDLERVAYYFDATWKDTLGGSSYDEVIALTASWMEKWRQPDVPRLTMLERADGGMDILDTRAERQTWSLDSKQASTYRQLSDITTMSRLCADSAALSKTSIAVIEGHLERFLGWELAIEEDGQLLGLALPPLTNPPLADRALQMRKRVNQTLQNAEKPLRLAGS